MELQHTGKSLTSSVITSICIVHITGHGYLGLIMRISASISRWDGVKVVRDSELLARNFGEPRKFGRVGLDAHRALIGKLHWKPRSLTHDPESDSPVAPVQTRGYNVFRYSLLPSSRR